MADLLSGLAYGAAAIAETLTLSIAGIASYPISPSGDAYLALARLWGKTMLRMVGATVTVEGRERVDFNRPQVYMVNHQSHTDILALYASIPTPVRMLAKTQLKWIPVFGWGMAVADFVFIDRSNRERAFRTIEEAAQKIAAGSSIVVFPEGTRSRDGRLGDFKKGGFVLAQKSAVPIVPVGIVGTYGILPRHSLRLAASDVTVRFGDPIATVGIERDALMAKVHDAIAALSRGAAEAAAASGRLPRD
ncbi:MAG TPA: lysophospholipid acyltransferase family protein [Polyangia bacterium]|jgi:1-acyl-sn-glycerol-3-phosphate acyltransferase